MAGERPSTGNASAPAPKRKSRHVVAALVACVGFLVLADLAVETVLAPSDMRWAAAGIALAIGAVGIAAWRWLGSRAAATVFVVGVLAFGGWATMRIGGALGASERLASLPLARLARVLPASLVAPAAGASGDAATTPGGTAAGGPAGAHVEVAPLVATTTNKAIEVRVVSTRIANTIGDRTPAAGQAFYVIETAWKNIIQPVSVNRKAAADRTKGAGGLGFGASPSSTPAEDAANTTVEPVAFQMGEMPTHVWLIADGRFAERIDVEATTALDGSLPTDTLEIAAFGQVRTGTLVYQAPADAKALSLLILDSAHGHLLIPVRGDVPHATALDNSRSNEFLVLAPAGTRWSSAPPAPGTRTFIVNLRGLSRQDAIVDVPFSEFGFLQTDQGCIALPDEQAAGVTRPLAPVGRFLPMVPNEGELAFTVPADTRSASLLLRLPQGGSIDLALLGDGSAHKPPTISSYQDGTVLRVGVVGTSPSPANLTPPAAGSEYVVVDYVVENLREGTGLELQTAEQFSVVDGGGASHAPEDASKDLACRLTGAGVVPSGGWRRFSLLYAVPAGQSLKLHYRGFEGEGTLKIR